MKTYVFDLDNTLCYNEGEHLDYKSSKPHLDRIKIVNDLYEQGCKIIIDTARGSETGINWFSITESQLKEWKLKYHVLRCGIKFAADVYVDDKAINDLNFFREHDEL